MTYKYLSKCADFQSLKQNLNDWSLNDIESKIADYEEMSVKEYNIKYRNWYPEAICWYECGLTTEDLIYYYQDLEGDNKVKKYTLENYDEFCKEALQVPPVESFEDGSIDEDKWYKQHNIHIVTGNHDIELDYNADNVNEIEYALREMYEVEMDIRGATTGNTITKRVATMKDLVQYYLLDKSYEYSDKEFPKYVKNIFDVNWIKFYESIAENEKYDEYEDWIDCDFRTFDARTFTSNRDKLKEIVLSLIGTNYTIRTDGEVAFIVDYSLKTPGVLINWFYYSDNDNLDEIAKAYIEMYKKELFKEEE